ncbi:TauD/TfdA dioxygenase family protein [Halopseudomonas xiamenensis]|uniref:TauD/TfdA dioxygenase family protein n=1 Tax=Halopseudomonas xiamenensis TaxID=157792 RepID=UPI00162667FF|nr:TauD/TfdA family dioxygenase [Halopseudomonas xiamenensis]
MSYTITPTSGACGATVAGLDLSKELDQATIENLRAAWLQHQVLVFTGQDISDADLERFSLYFGSFAGDPYIASLDDNPNIIELRRAADETTPIFADAWHTDWSFGANPPSATILYGITIPPHGGNTDFVNQKKALQKMPQELRSRLEGKNAIHSARRAYAPTGAYGDGEKESGKERGFKIKTSESAYDTQAHPIIRKHPETGEETLFGCVGYIIGVEDMAEDEANQLLMELYTWQTRPEFQYNHEWKPGMVVMWDNRSVLHKANGGYEGYERVLHRTVIS